ncbi:unnamed protein product [Acanthoscelides obtectus]|uniref:HAT C-terminal dimerisation domain-containing protein n=1 Tax=Acanthoscelides obtectus TaxID=200917 RepID=A0A9P0KPW2_ACAOB|nr:unnamed protein product [Acanthoscelides obtectus]CAK1655956.1 hypothetical protein AOBTE_LOCUS19466 [Acanthoscelides obtectus]
MTTAESERCFSTLKRIKTFLRSSMNEERLSAVAMLRCSEIESMFLLTMQTTKEKYSSKTKAPAADHDNQYSNVVGNKKNDTVSLRAKTKP